MLSGRVKLSSAEARVEEIKGGSVGVLEAAQVGARLTAKLAAES